MFVKVDSASNIILRRMLGFSSGDIPMTCAERFSLYIQEREEIELRPVFTIEGVTYIYVKVR